jgi:hypothetical protein
VLRLRSGNFAACFDNAFDSGAPPPTPKPGSAAPGEYAIFFLERAYA